MHSSAGQSVLSLLHPLRPVQALYRHRELLWQFTVRNVELRHKGSMLGIVWALLNPLLMLGLYVFVFAYIFGGRFNGLSDETKWDYGLAVFLSLSLFHVIAESTAVAPSIIVGNPNFVKKVVFPLEILPAAAVGAAAFHMIVSLGLVCVGILLGGRGVSANMLWLPVIILPLIGFALGISWTISALGVFFRDLGQLVGLAVTGLMFASAVFYPAARIEAIPGAWSILRFNPLVHILEMARATLLWARPVNLVGLGWLCVAGYASALLGYACFVRLKRAFADVL